MYTLPKLPYNYEDLEPVISEDLMMIHHTKHHQAYVNGANAILERLETARKNNTDLDMKSTLKEFSFNVSGHMLHSIFWNNLLPVRSGGGGMPKGMLMEMINKDFNSFERFKKEFNQAANSVEGSGWAALVYSEETDSLILVQIEKHNMNLFPELKILMVLDVFEHAYYLDYKNERGKFVNAIWDIINWDNINSRLEEAKK